MVYFGGFSPEPSPSDKQATVLFLFYLNAFSPYQFNIHIIIIIPIISPPPRKVCKIALYFFIFLPRTNRKFCDFTVTNGVEVHTILMIWLKITIINVKYNFVCAKILRIDVWVLVQKFMKNYFTHYFYYKIILK